MKVVSGNLKVDTTDGGWTLDTGSGNRWIEKPITFSSAFATVPEVTLGLTHLDVDRGFNTRVTVTALNVTKTGFTIRTATFADSKIYGVAMSYFAHD